MDRLLRRHYVSFRLIELLATATLESLSLYTHDGKRQFKVEGGGHRPRKEFLKRGFAACFVHGRRFLVVDEVADLDKVGQVKVATASQSKLQILNRDVQTAPKGILYAVDGGRCEHFHFDVFCQRVLSLTSTNVRIPYRFGR